MTAADTLGCAIRYGLILGLRSELHDEHGNGIDDALFDKLLDELCEARSVEPYGLLDDSIKIELEDKL